MALCRSPDCILLLFLGEAIPAVIGAGNCPLSLRRDEVSCCVLTGDICGLMSATISHTSSEDAEDGEQGPVLLVLVCVYFFVATACQIRLGALIAGSQASSTTFVVTGLLSVAVGASPVHMVFKDGGDNCA